MSSTELEVPQSMHIDAHDGVIARSPISPDTEESADKGETESQDPRKDAMAAIIAKRAQVLAQELDTAQKITEDSHPETEVTSEVDPEPVVEAKKADEVQANEIPAKEQVASPAPKKILVVDGRPIEVNDDELVRLAQTGLTATQRFQQAAYMQQQAEVAKQNSQPQSGLVPQSIDEARAKEIARRLTFGSEEESVKAILDLANVAASNGGRANALPAEQLVDIATQRAVEQIEFKQNIEAIGKEYPEIFNSRRAMIAAADTVGELRTKYQGLGVAKSYMDLYREACTLTRDEFFGKREASEPASKTNPPVQSAAVLSMKDKVERKRAAPQPPAAASKIATETVKSPYPTGSQIVESMRKARGQSVYS